MVNIIKVNGKQVKLKVKVDTKIYNKKMFSKVNGETINKKDLALKLIKIILNFKDNIKMVKKMEKENLFGMIKLIMKDNLKII